MTADPRDAPPQRRCRSATHASGVALVPTAAGLALGAVADLLLADPRRGHPVAGFGRRRGRAGAPDLAGLAGRGRRLRRRAARRRRRPWGRRWHRADRRPAGGPHRWSPPPATWTVLGRHVARPGGRPRCSGTSPPATCPRARARAASLAGRDPSALGEAELARATVESVAENTSDAAVAPLFWGAVAGVPGLLGLPGGEHPGRDGRVPLAAVRAVRLGGRAARRRRQLGAGPAHRRPHRGLRARWPAAHRPAPGAPGGGTAPPTPARTPGGARPRWPARWACGWAGATSTAAGSRSGRRSATAGRRRASDIRRAVRLSRAVWAAAAVPRARAADGADGRRGCTRLSRGTREAGRIDTEVAGGRVGRGRAPRGGRRAPWSPRARPARAGTGRGPHHLRSCVRVAPSGLVESRPLRHGGRMPLVDEQSTPTSSRRLIGAVGGLPVAALRRYWPAGSATS